MTKRRNNNNFDYYAEFSDGNDFGNVLLQLIDEEFEDAEEAVITLAEEAGVEEEDILDLIEGSAIATPDVADSLANAFDSLDEEEVYDGFMTVAVDTYNSALDAEELEEEEDESYYDDEYEEEGEENIRGRSSSYDDEYEDDEQSISDGEYVYDPREEGARYSQFLGEDEMADFGDSVDELQERLDAIEFESAIKSALADLEGYSNSGVNEGWLPPVVQNMLMGDFNREDDRLASFSSVCEGNEVDVETQLYAMKFALDMFNSLGPIAQFSTYASNVDFISPEDEAVSNSIEDAAVASLKVYRSSR